MFRLFRNGVFKNVYVQGIGGRSFFHGAGVAAPQSDIDRLLGGKPLFVPLAREQVLTGEERTKILIAFGHSVERTIRHHVQQRMNWRTGLFDTAVGKVVQRHCALGFDDGVHTGGEIVHALSFRAQKLFGEDGTRDFEDAPHKMIDKGGGDAVAQAADSTQRPL